MESQPLEMETERPMKCSVVILNWNGEEMLRRYLPAVVEKTPDEGCEVVVADNGSTDGSLQVLAEFPSVRVIRLAQNYGFAEGYNRALAETDSEYCVLLNSDVEVTDGWLTALLAYMDAHPDVSACQPRIRSLRNRTKFEHAGAAGGEIDRLGYPYCRGRIMGYTEEDHGQYTDSDDLFWASGACMCIRSQAFREAGGLDSDFFAHMEEIDLCWRLQCRGGKTGCACQSMVYHLGGGSLHYENPRKTYLNFRNNLLMLYKNLPEDRLRSIMFQRTLLDYAAALQMLLCGHPKNALAVIKARRDYQRMIRTEQFQSKRRENLEKAVIPYPPTIRQRSILADYYLRGKRH